MADQPAPDHTEATRAAEHDLGTPFDLTACAREAIHRLGAVQSYGCLVAAFRGTIQVVSANTGALLGVAPADLIGEPVGLLLDTDDGGLGPAPGRTVVLRPRTSTRRFAVTTHVSDGLDVLEFEPVTAEPTTLSVAAVSRTLHRLQDCETVTAACHAAVHEIQALTGYDRVVAYRFASLDGPGEVIAEAATPGHDPWLGLWFPATDVPPAGPGTVSP